MYIVFYGTDVSSWYGVDGTCIDDAMVGMLYLLDF